MGSPVPQAIVYEYIHMPRYFIFAEQDSITKKLPLRKQSFTTICIMMGGQVLLQVLWGLGIILAHYNTLLVYIIPKHWLTNSLHSTEYAHTVGQKSSIFSSISRTNFGWLYGQSMNFHVSIHALRFTTIYLNFNIIEKYSILATYYPLYLLGFTNLTH